MPDANPVWLEPFSQGLLALADAEGCELIGGDTTPSSAVVQTAGHGYRLERGLLLQALANDLAFGIGNLRAQQEARRDAHTRIEILRIQQEIASNPLSV